MFKSLVVNIKSFFRITPELIGIFNDLIIEGKGFFAGIMTVDNLEYFRYLFTVITNFSQDIADVGHGNSNWQIGIEWANATTGSLQWWKWFIDEGGIRVPLIVVPPKSHGDKFTRLGDVSDTFLSVKDLPMTILQYAGVEHPMTSYQGRDIVPPSGKSMVNFLDGEAKTVYGPDDWTAFELFGNAYVVRGDYKAIKVRAGMWGDG